MIMLYIGKLNTGNLWVANTALKQNTLLKILKMNIEQKYQEIRPEIKSQTQKQTFDDFTAIGLTEGFIESETEEQVIAAWQHLFDTGLCFRLQGRFGRTALSLVEQGVIKVKD